MYVSVIIRYICKPGTRERMLEEMKSAGAEDCFRKCRGNICYKLSASATNQDAIDLCDVWDSEESFKEHTTNPMCKVTAEIRSRYVIDRNALILRGEEYDF